MTAFSSVVADSVLADTAVPSRLTTSPIPDPRPTAVHWHRSPLPRAAMRPLPLWPEDVGSGIPTASNPTEQELEALRAHARSLLGALVDAIQGRRPLAQLTRWVSDDVIATLRLQVRAHQQGPVALAVRSVHVQLVNVSVAEVSARLQADSRFAAAALRLERVGMRWFCPVAEFGPLTRGAGQRRL